VNLSVYDMLGREVGVLVDGVQSPGIHEVTFAPEHPSSVASGKYFYRLQVGERTETRTMMYLK